VALATGPNDEEEEHMAWEALTARTQVLLQNQHASENDFAELNESVNLEGLVSKVPILPRGARVGVGPSQSPFLETQKHADTAPAPLESTCASYNLIVMNWMSVKAATDMICYIRAHLWLACSRVIQRHVSQWIETVNLNKSYPPVPAMLIRASVDVNSKM